MCIFGVYFWKKVYKLLVLQLEKVFISRNVFFREHIFTFSSKESIHFFPKNSSIPQTDHPIPHFPIYHQELSDSRTTSPPSSNLPTCSPSPTSPSPSTTISSHSPFSLSYTLLTTLHIYILFWMTSPLPSQVLLLHLFIQYLGGH